MSDSHPVQTLLTLVLTLKSGQDFQALAKALQQKQADGSLAEVLDRISTVHFARFVFLENNAKLAIITTFDGRLRRTSARSSSRSAMCSR